VAVAIDAGAFWDLVIDAYTQIAQR
jgi:hypothetical protein